MATKSCCLHTHSAGSNFIFIATTLLEIHAVSSVNQPTTQKKSFIRFGIRFQGSRLCKSLWKVTKGIGMLRFVRTIYTCNARMIFFETKLTARHRRHHKMEHTRTQRSPPSQPTEEKRRRKKNPILIKHECVTYLNEFNICSCQRCQHKTEAGNQDTDCVCRTHGGTLHLVCQSPLLNVTFKFLSNSF